NRIEERTLSILGAERHTDVVVTARRQNDSVSLTSGNERGRNRNLGFRSAIRSNLDILDIKRDALQNGIKIGKPLVNLAKRNINVAGRASTRKEQADRCDPAILSIQKRLRNLLAINCVVVDDAIPVGFCPLVIPELTE